MDSFTENILHTEEGGKYLNDRFYLSFTMFEIETFKQPLRFYNFFLTGGNKKL